MSDGLHDPSLTFRWAGDKRYSLMLPGFIAASAVAHAFTFYVFQVVYPPTVSITPPPAQVGLLSASVPEHQALLRWVEAEDPTTIHEPQEVMPPSLLSPRYVPSYAEIATMPRQAPEDTEPVPFPPARDALSVIRSVIRPWRPPAPEGGSLG